MSEQELTEYQQAVADLVPEGAKVLDIGCGRGRLLQWLTEHKHVKGFGIELESARVAEAVAKGLSVVQGNADEDLAYYPDDAFDVVMMSLTLQVMRDPKAVLEQALRVGKQVIVAIPNFGHIRNRFYLLLQGRMPVTSQLSYQWYETPNIHFCTIKDMVQLAEALGTKIITRHYLTNAGRAKSFCGYGSMSANLTGKYGVFVLER